MYDEKSILSDLTKNASQMNMDELNGYGALAYAIAQYNFDEMLLKEGYLTVERYEDSIKALSESEIRSRIQNLIERSNISERCYMDKDTSPALSFVHRREMFESNILISIYYKVFKGLGYSI